MSELLRAIHGMPEPASANHSDESIQEGFVEFQKRVFPEIGNFGHLHYYYKPLDGPVLYCLHGAGSSAMTFAHFASKTEFGVFAYDMRGHGLSERGSDYFLDSLVEEAGAALEFLKKKHSGAIYLVGHSLGGAVLTALASRRDPQVRGLIVLDIVEETATHALQAMPRFISNRPASFKLYAEAVKWHLQGHLLRNEASARISVVHLLKRDKGLVWRTNLKDLAPFWDSWFTGLSHKFNTAPVAKLLVLSGNETLDKELIIGQMQGKYQLVVLTGNGHFIQEDVPEKLALSILDFVKRLAEPIVPKWGGEVHP